MSDRLWVNLGCADDIRPDMVNIDCKRFTAKEKATGPCFERNLDGRWPFVDSTVDFILAVDIIEHLQDKIHTMNEAWRILKPGGRIHIEVPTTEGRGAFQDPTHLSFWNRNSFFYFTHGDPHRERFGDSYGMNARFMVISERQDKLADEVVKLTIVLEAVK